jgi:hypothetical protein
MQTLNSTASSFKDSCKLLLLSAMLFSGCSCGHEPPADGELFECRLGERFWQARVDVGYLDMRDSDPVRIAVDSSWGDQIFVDIRARIDVKDVREDIHITILAPKDSVMNVVMPRDNTASTVTHSTGRSGERFFLDTTRISILNFSVLDRIARKAVGTFDFHLINLNGETLHVTDGKFDLKLDD